MGGRGCFGLISKSTLVLFDLRLGVGGSFGQKSKNEHRFHFEKYRLPLNIYLKCYNLLAELNMDVKSDMRAANMTAIIMPFSPVGIMFMTSSG